MVLLAVLVLVALVLQADPASIGEIMRAVDLGLVAVVVVLYLLNTIAKIARWYALLEGKGYPVPAGRVALYFLVGMAVNNATPGRIAGEPARAYLLKTGTDYPMGRGMASIFLEKTIDTIVTISLALVGILLLMHVIPSTATYKLLLSAGMVALLAGCLILLLVYPAGPRRISEWVFTWLQRRRGSGSVARMRGVVDGFLGTFEQGTKEISRDRTRGSVAIGLTVVIWLNEALRLWVVFLALGYNISAELMLVAVTLASFAALLIPLGAGSSVAIVAICVLAGVDGDLATAASLLFIMTSVWLSVPLGAAAMMVTGLRMDHIPSASRLMSEAAPPSSGGSEPLPSDGGVPAEPKTRP